ncbi:MAG: Gfo/Idh/MocA family oxidoreductase, partial [Candidatus Latescibacteria bacterium]|nr:Gfo/Idh/MocA family oxidoreductase [Candidatus Latescibacterota bacterium]
KVVDLRAELAQEVGGELDCAWTDNLDDALNDDNVDVVLVMTPSGLHGDVAIKVLEAGKHAVTTKPMEVSVEKCDAMIEAASRAGKLLGVDFQERYADIGQKTKHAIDTGLFGKPILCESRLKWFRTQEYYDAGGWRGTWAMDGGGSLANQGSHLIDLLLWFMGTPTRVYGETAIMNHEIETEDIGQAILNFESGAKGGILGTTTFPDSPYFSAEVHGTEGGVLIDAALSGEMRVFGDGLEEKLQAIHNPLANVVEDVVSALNEGTPLRVDGREGRRTVALLENIYRSSREGKAVDYCD